MPTDKKRINLTIPDPLYERLQAYKERVGILSDATACLQLVTQQLNAQETTETVMEFIRRSSTQQLLQLSSEGITQVKEVAEQNASSGPPKKADV